MNGDRAIYWLKRGAQPSSAVRKLLQISGAWAEFSGEAAPAPVPRKTTKAASVTATPAASVDEEPVADLPEADDQAGAAPEAAIEPEG